MKIPISLTSISVCLILGQTLYPQSVQATARIDTKNSIPISSVVFFTPDQMAQNKSASSENKQDFPRCVEKCDNSGDEGGGGG